MTTQAMVRDVTAAEVGFFRTNGWALLRGLIARDAVGRVAAAARALMGDCGDNRKPSREPFTSIWRTFDEPAYQSTELWDFATMPEVGRVGSRLLGNRPVRFLRDEFYLKLPTDTGEGRPTPWHQDYPYANRDRAGQVNLWIPLHDVPADGAGLRYLSGSHRAGSLGRALADPANDLVAQYPELLDEYEISERQSLEVGDVLVHHGLTVHSADANTSSITRWAYTVVLFDAAALYTGVPWPRRLVDRMSGIQLNRPFEHTLTPITWTPTSARKDEAQ